MRKLVLFFAVCTLAVAMVPRHKRAVNTEEDEELLRREAEEALANKNKKDDRKDCGEITACRWVIYNNTPVDMVINNTYCECKDPRECLYFEDNRSASSYVYRCQDPEHAVDEESDNS